MNLYNDVPNFLLLPAIHLHVYNCFLSPITYLMLPMKWLKVARAVVLETKSVKQQDRGSQSKQQMIDMFLH